ncbi:unnamed protein product [Rhizopus microsporus]
MANVAIDAYKCLNVLALIGFLLNFIGDFVIIYPLWYFIIPGVFKLLLFLALCVVEFTQIPVYTKHWSFLYSFLGRALFYIVFSMIFISVTTIGFAGSIIIVFCGVVYLVLHFVLPGKEPAHMSYSTFLTIVGGSGNLPTANVNVQQTQLQQQHLPPPTANGQQYPFVHQSPLPAHQAVNPSPLPAHQVISQVPSPAPYHEQQHVASSPMQSPATYDSQEKVEVSH